MGAKFILELLSKQLLIRILIKNVFALNKVIRNAEKPTLINGKIKQMVTSISQCGKKLICR